MNRDCGKMLASFSGAAVALVATGTFTIHWKVGCIATGLVLLRVVRLCVEAHR